MGGARALSIGEAAALLAEQFPGLGTATLRRLDAEGLVSPDRTPAGYRRYRPADIVRLRALLAPRGAERRPVTGPALVPARAAAPARAGRPAPIPDALPSPDPAIDAGLVGAVASETSATADVSDVTTSEQAAQLVLSAPRRAPRWTEADFFAPDLGEVAFDRDQLASAVRIDRAWVDELVTYGLLTGAQPVGGAELLVARAAADLAGFGLEPRHLRVVAASASRVAALIESTAPASRRGRAGAAPVTGHAARTAAAVVRLHAALVRSALARSTAR